MFQMTAFSVETGQQTTPPLIHGVVDNKQTITHILHIYYVISNIFFK